MRSFEPRQLKVSVVTVYELEYGARRNQQRQVGRTIRAFLQNVETLPFDSAAAREAGAVRAELEALGSVIGAYDLLIAGHARSINATLVTNNVREFGRVKGLSLENWASKSA